MTRSADASLRLHEVARRLIAFDTVSTRSNAEAMAYLADCLDRPGVRVAVQRFVWDGIEGVNLLATAGPPEPDGLVISGHVDVVPFEGQPGWTRDALAFAVDDARAYGRGASDMKGFVAQCVVMAASLDVGRLARPLVLAFTAAEEVGSRGARALVGDLPALLADVPAPRLAWIGEPTSYQIFRAHKAIVSFEVVVHGTAAHASRPDRGVNAIVVAAEVVDRIGRCQGELRAGEGDPVMFPDCPSPTLNVGMIHGGTAVNTVAEECRVKVSYRPLPGQDPRAVHRDIVRRLADVDGRDRGGSAGRATIVVGEPLIADALLTPPGTRLERALLELLGPRPVLGASFATDGPELKAAGLDSLVCGPGDLDQAHQPNESIDRQAFENGPGLLRAVVERLCTGSLDRAAGRPPG
jgi:acetylornithine deacetylase